MSTDPRRAKDLFLAALDRSAEDRSPFLDEACPGDVGLRAAVEQLLAAHAHPASAVGRPPVSPGAHGDVAAADNRGDEADEHLGAVLAGKYKLVEEIGEGGMGSVYMAQQTEPVKRVVAVKVIKAGMDSKAVLARFDAERQALALMDHPNIAKVLDAGTTDSGRPFFVMELVKGVPITQYCDDQKLTPRQRLELFVPVCNAIQHAHQKGVIHRDIKPSNVLVARYDDRPVPKVIDFGVAKATEQALTDKTLLTGFGAVVGTPEYMSPEQANLNNRDIDTRSDVYSLGVLLYELLTGTTPVDLKSLGQAALLEVLRIVREVEAPRPSAKLSTSAALPDVAANRGIEPAKLPKLMQGELDWIVMKALEKDRTRRYETTNGLAADIVRHLAYEPVQAAPPSTLYRLRKFVRKNRGPVVAAGLVVVALLVGIAGATWGMIRAENRRVEAEVARAAESQRVTERDEALGKADENAKKARENAEKAGENARRAEAEAGAARKAETEAKARAKAEAEAKGVAQREKERADDQLRRAERLVYLGKLSLAQNAFAEGNPGLALDYLNECQWNLRGWEHRYLWTRFNAKQTFLVNTGAVTSVAWSPDGTRIVTGSVDGTARVWDAEKGREVLALKGHTDRVDSVAFSPDGKRIITGGWDGTARVWDANTGQKVLALKGPIGTMFSSVCFSPDGTRIVTGTVGGWVRVWNADTGHEVFAPKVASRNVAFSPDGKRIVTGSYDTTARVLDAGTGQEVLALRGHTGAVTSVAFCPDGKQIVTSDGTARVWDAGTGQEVLTLKGRTNNVTSVAFSMDGMRIVTGGNDNTARVLDAATGQEVFALRGHTNKVTSVAFSPDGTRIVTGSEDQTARVWDADTGQEVRAFKGRSNPVPVWSAAFSPDGKRIVTDEGLVRDAATGHEVLALKGHTGPVYSPAFSPDGTRIVTGGHDGTVRVWDAATGHEVRALKGHTGAVTSVAFSPDGKQIVTGSGDQTVRVWDAATGQDKLAFKAHPTGTIMSMSLSPDGKRIVTGGGWDNTAVVWDAATGHELLRLRLTGQVRSVAFSPDGRRIVTGAAVVDSQIKLAGALAKVWDAATGQEVLALKGHTGGVTSVSFSPDGRRIVTGSDDKTARVWYADTGQEVLTLKGHSYPVKSVAFSPDGTRIVTCDGRVWVWDADKGPEVLALKGHTGTVTSAAFSPDGKRLVTGSWDSNYDDTARVWDVNTGQEVLTLKGHLVVTSVAWSPDGTRIVTGSGDLTARVWDAKTGHELLALTGHTQLVRSVAFSPDGKRIVTGSGEGQQALVAPGEVKVWAADTGKEVLALNGHTSGVYGVAFSPDGTRIVTGSADGTVRVWDADKGREVLALMRHTGWVTSVAFSPDGKRVFAWDTQNKVLWSAASGQPIDPVDPPAASPPGLARSPDGFIRAVPEGNVICVTDSRTLTNENAWPLPDAAERKRYHTEQAALALAGTNVRLPQQAALDWAAGKQWFAVAFHLGRLLLDAPDDADLKRRREEALRRHAAAIPVVPPVMELAK